MPPPVTEDDLVRQLKQDIVATEQWSALTQEVSFKRAFALLYDIAALTRANSPIPIVTLEIAELLTFWSDIATFIKTQKGEPQTTDESEIIAFLHGLKARKQEYDSGQPLAADIWHQALLTRVYTHPCWLQIAFAKKGLAETYLNQLSIELAKAPLKVAIGRLGDSFIAAVLNQVDKVIVNQTTFSHITLEQLVAWFIEENATRSSHLHQRTSAQGVGTTDTGPIRERPSGVRTQLTGLDISRALPKTLNPVTFLGAFYTGEQDNSKECFLEPSALPDALSNTEIKHICFPAGSGGHWRGVWIEKKPGWAVTLHLFDSFGRHSAEAIRDEMVALIKDARRGVTVNVEYHQPKYTQSNVYSCGHFTVAFFHRLCKQLKVTGFSKRLNQVFSEPQSAVTEAVVAHHDRSMERPAWSTPVITGAKPPSTVTKKAAMPRSRPLPPRPKPSTWANGPLQTSEELVKPLPVQSLPFMVEPSTTASVNPLAGLGVSFQSTKPKSLEERADVKAVREQVARLQTRASKTFWFWLKPGLLAKATLIEKALQAYLDDHQRPDNVLADEGIRKAVTQYRHFGFFHHCTGKETKSVQAILPYCSLVN